MSTNSIAYSSLPDEIVRQIVSQLSTPDLQNVRLVDRKLCRSASEVFFGTFTLINDWKSIHRARHIGLHDTWVENVREVRWGPYALSSMSRPSIQRQCTLINKLRHVKCICFFGPTYGEFTFSEIIDALLRKPKVVEISGVRSSLTHRNNHLISLQATPTCEAYEASKSLNYDADICMTLGSFSCMDRTFEDHFWRRKLLSTQ